MTPARRHYAAVFLVSLSILMLEIAVYRLGFVFADDAFAALVVGREDGLPARVGRVDA